MLLSVISVVLGRTIISVYVMCLILPVDLFPEEIVGTASGLVISLGYVGGLIGLLLAGYLADTTGSFSFIPLFLALISVAIVFVSVSSLRTIDKIRVSAK
jgi:sugar phosphate permease